MNLVNYLNIRISLILGIILAFWAIIYFFIEMHQIQENIDDGLKNMKQEFILEANKKRGFIESMVEFSPINMRIEEIDFDDAKQLRDEFMNTEVYLKSEDVSEDVRMLVSAFRCDKNDKYYLIKFFTSTVEADDLISNLSMLLIALWLAIFISILISGKIIIRKASKPFYVLLDTLKTFDLNQRKMIEFPESNISEYQELNIVIEELLKNNIQSYEDQKIFIENASHELQTPLAIISSKVENLLNDTDISEKTAQELSAIFSNIGRMKRLNSNLLLLSKIKNRQFSNLQPIDLTKKMEVVLDNFGDMLDHKGITVEQIENGHPTLSMDKDLCYIMISNLIKNAVNYNIEQGKIIIILNPDSFEICNTSSEGAPDTDLFNRYTSKNSSNGLGLSIVKSIIDFYGFMISYTYKDSLHRVKIGFKKVE